MEKIILNHVVLKNKHGNKTTIKAFDYHNNECLQHLLTECIETNKKHSMFKFKLVKYNEVIYMYTAIYGNNKGFIYNVTSTIEEFITINNIVYTTIEKIKELGLEPINFKMVSNYVETIDENELIITDKNDEFINLKIGLNVNALKCKEISEILINNNYIYDNWFNELESTRNSVVKVNDDDIFKYGNLSSNQINELDYEVQNTLMDFVFTNGFEVSYSLHNEEMIDNIFLTEVRKLPNSDYSVGLMQGQGSELVLFLNDGLPKTNLELYHEGEIENENVDLFYSYGNMNNIKNISTEYYIETLNDLNKLNPTVTIIKNKTNIVVIKPKDLSAIKKNNVRYNLYDVTGKPFNLSLLIEMLELKYNNLIELLTKLGVENNLRDSMIHMLTYGKTDVNTNFYTLMKVFNKESFDMSYNDFNNIIKYYLNYEVMTHEKYNDNFKIIYFNESLTQFFITDKPDVKEVIINEVHNKTDITINDCDTTIKTTLVKDSATNVTVSKIKIRNENFYVLCIK